MNLTGQFLISMPSSQDDRFDKTVDASVYEMIPVVLLIISILFVGLYPSFITDIFKNGIIQTIG